MQDLDQPVIQALGPQSLSYLWSNLAVVVEVEDADHAASLNDKESKIMLHPVWQINATSDPTL